MFLRRRERLCLFSSNKCKLFQDVDDILLGTIHHLSLWRFLFCLEELTWFSRRTKWDQSSPTKGGLWKIDSHKAKGGGGEGGGGGRNHKLQSLWKDRQTVCNLHPSDNPRATRDGLWTALPSNSRQASSNTPAWILHEWFKRLSVREWSRNWDPLQLINTFYR